MKTIPLNKLCRKGVSALRQKDIANDGPYPVYGASGIVGYSADYQNEKRCVAVIKDGAGVGRANICTPKSSVLGTMQALIPAEGVECDYLLHLVRSLHLDAGFTGSTIPHIYFKDYGKRLIVEHNAAEQCQIAESLNAIEVQIADCGVQAGKLDELVKSRFVEMFGDSTRPHDGWAFARIDAFCDVITGNTPSRKKPEYYGDYIEWIKTDNITEAAYLTEATERLSESGAGVGRIAPAGSVLMACIAGSVKSIGKVAIADRDVAFNQQINALVPHKGAIETEYLLWMLRLSKDYLCCDINMQLKGILNKSNLSKKEFAVPPLPLQQEFAAFVQQVDKLKFDSLIQLGGPLAG